MITLAPRIRAALVAATATLALGCAAVPARAALPQLGGSVDLASYKPNAAADGAASSDQAGTAVAAAGDGNGDGLADGIGGAPNADANARRDSGSAFVVFGRADGASLDLGRIGSGGGFRIDGAATTDRLGAAVSPAGDVNGDGLADVIVGARFADPAGRLDAGAAYVVAGKAAGATVDLSSPGTASYAANGAAAGDGAGAALAQGGDLDGDGRGELLLGAPGAGNNGRAGSGSAYVLLGVDAGGTHDLAALDATWRIDGAAAGDQAGSSLAAGSHVNSDGRVDLVVGTPFADRSRADTGGARLLYGGRFAGSVDLA